MEMLLIVVSYWLVVYFYILKLMFKEFIHENVQGFGNK
jgi:hypothetical protein